MLPLPPDTCWWWPICSHNRSPCPSTPAPPLCHMVSESKAQAQPGIRPAEGGPGSPGVHDQGSPGRLTCVQGLWPPQRRGPGGGWPTIHHMHTALLSLFGCQPLLQGLDEELLFLHTDQAGLWNKNEMLQIPRAQQADQGGGVQGESQREEPLTRPVGPEGACQAPRLGARVEPQAGVGEGRAHTGDPRSPICPELPLLVTEARALKGGESGRV